MITSFLLRMRKYVVCVLLRAVENISIKVSNSSGKFHFYSFLGIPIFHFLIIETSPNHQNARTGRCRKSSLWNKFTYAEMPGSLRIVL